MLQRCGELDENELGLTNICSPPDTHAEIVTIALDKGCNRSIEKPFTF
jgi:predicted dehydrogenase